MQLLFRQDWAWTIGGRGIGLPCPQTEAFQNLTELLQGVEKKLAWPRQALAVLIRFLLKPDGIGERPIGLTPGLYRLWCNVRKIFQLQWEDKKAARWDNAVRGSSALQCALRTQVMNEVCAVLGVPAAGILWDGEQFSTISGQKSSPGVALRWGTRPSGSTCR